MTVVNDTGVDLTVWKKGKKNSEDPNACKLIRPAAGENSHSFVFRVKRTDCSDPPTQPD